MNKSKSKNNRCRSIRLWIVESIGDHFPMTLGRLQKHITECPRCQKRLVGFNRISLGLSLLKSQVHRVDLLSQANQQAIGVLRRSLRDIPKAHTLRKAQPKQKFLDRISRHLQPTTNAAACLFIFFLVRMGVFASAENIQTECRETMKCVYAKRR